MQLKKLLFFAFITSITFSACSDDKDYQEEEKVEYEWTGISPLRTDHENGGDRLPMSWDSFNWKYSNAKLVSFSPSYAVNIHSVDVTEYSKDILKAEGNYNMIEGSMYEIYDVTIESEDGLVKKERISSFAQGSSIANFTKEYHYNAEGYLTSITQTPNTENAKSTVVMSLTWENGNVTKLVTGEESYWKTVFNYTYDDKEYIPMSDLAVYAPLFLYCPSPQKEFYNKMGKTNKNNVKEVTMEYSYEKLSNDITKLTYETVLNKDNTIKQINHTGAYYPHFSEDDYKLISFKGVITVFNYSPVINK